LDIKGVKKNREKGRDDEHPAFDVFRILIYDLFFFLPNPVIPSRQIPTSIIAAGSGYRGLDRGQLG